MDFVNSIIARLVRSIPDSFWRRNFFYGDFSSWESALSLSDGYDSPTIFHKVEESATKVKSGKCIFERDGVCFYHQEIRWPVLALILNIALKLNGRLHLLDFGGSLGSFYFQHKGFLDSIEFLKWSVVEQGHYVECGRKKFADDRLLFFDSISSCHLFMPINAALFSSVLQYIEKPFEILQDIGERGVQFVLIDRTPLGVGSRDKLTIQRVSKKIYNASYPAWFFSREKFNRFMRQLGYQLIMEFPCNEKSVKGYEYKGLFYELVGEKTALER